MGEDRLSSVEKFTEKVIDLEKRKSGQFLCEGGLHLFEQFVFLEKPEHKWEEEGDLSMNALMPLTPPMEQPESNFFALSGFRHPRPMLSEELKPTNSDVIFGSRLELAPLP